MQNAEAICLGIESTADDFGVGIARFNGEILANAIDGYIPLGRIHPREAVGTTKSLTKVKNKTLTGRQFKDLTCIAFAGQAWDVPTPGSLLHVLTSYIITLGGESFGAYRN